MDVRQARLAADLKVLRRFRSHVMSFQAIDSYEPPEAYHIHYELRSLVGFDGDSPVYRTGHDVEIRMPFEYPRVQPIVRLISQPFVLHPNIWADGRLCIEDRWIPGIGIPLDTLVERVGKIIAYQEINLRSPANRDSQTIAWVQAHQAEPGWFPLDKAQIRLPDRDDAIRFGDEESPQPRISFG